MFLLVFLHFSRRSTESIRYRTSELSILSSSCACLACWAVPSLKPWRILAIGKGDFGHCIDSLRHLVPLSVYYSVGDSQQLLLHHPRTFVVPLGLLPLVHQHSIAHAIQALTTHSSSVSFQTVSNRTPHTNTSDGCAGLIINGILAKPARCLGASGQAMAETKRPFAGIAS